MGHFFLAFDVHVQINPPPHEQRLKAIFLLPGNLYTKGVTGSKIDFLGFKGCIDVKYARP